MTPQEITRAREGLGLTQRALAEHLGVAANTVWRWEQGKTAPSPHHMQTFEAMICRKTQGRRAAEVLKRSNSEDVQRRIMFTVALDRWLLDHPEDRALIPNGAEITFYVHVPSKPV